VKKRGREKGACAKSIRLEVFVTMTIMIRSKLRDILTSLKTGAVLFRLEMRAVLIRLKAYVVLIRLEAHNILFRL
jgi:hypothetical protein